MNNRQRANLLKLAVYLESLPKNYEHFGMSDYAVHVGDCKLPMAVDLLAAQQPEVFVKNCGTVACAVGHGPAAGIALLPQEMVQGIFGNVRWYGYADRAFGADQVVGETPFEELALFDFLFAGEWAAVDDHHYGAAARIRYFLATGNAFHADDGVVRKYAPYRKGSRSAVRREIDTVAA